MKTTFSKLKDNLLIIIASRNASDVNRKFHLWQIFHLLEIFLKTLLLIQFLIKLEITLNGR